jgi:8-oxo-dGTP pyrophosphatase MutT (NUDIX family)
MLNANRKQYAALPYRVFDDQGLQVMLITSRGTGRWIVPKGWPMAGLKPWRAAAREAYEEAGIVGEIDKRAAGHYDYQKRLDDGTVTTCQVDVFPLRVKEELPRWPEQDQRTRRWFSPEEASGLVDEEGLQSLLSDLTKAGLFASRGKGRGEPAADNAADQPGRRGGSRLRRVLDAGASLVQSPGRRKKNHH